MWGTIFSWGRWLLPIVLGALAGYEGHYTYGTETKSQVVEKQLVERVVESCTNEVRVVEKRIYPSQSFLTTRGDSQCLVIIYPDGQRHTVGCT